MQFNDNIGKEDTHNEYKVFTLSLLDIENNEYTSFDDLCKWKYNNIAINTIESYLNTYLPKYISSFFNTNSRYTNIKNNTCNLYLGVDDDGTVLGIPYEGELNIEMFKNIIDNIFNNLMIYENVNDKNEIKNKVKIELIKLDYNDEIDSDECYNIMSDLYDKYNKETVQLTNDNTRLINLKNLWTKELYNVSIKLHNIINKKYMRDILLDYMKFNNDHVKKSINSFTNKYSKIYHYCEIESYYTFMARFKSSHQYEQTNNEYIQANLDNNLEIYTWLTRYKEERVKFLKVIKPNPIKKYATNDWIRILLSQFNTMVPIWKDRNDNLNLYVIKVSIDVSKRHNIQYNDNHGILTYSYRTIEYGVPLSKKFL